MQHRSYTSLGKGVESMLINITIDANEKYICGQPYSGLVAGLSVSCVGLYGVVNPWEYCESNISLPYHTN